MVGAKSHAATFRARLAAAGPAGQLPSAPPPVVRAEVHVQLRLGEPVGRGGAGCELQDETRAVHAAY